MTSLFRKGNHKKVFLGKKGQAAMEFLMIYGWVLMILALVFAVFVYSMTGKSSSLALESCIFLPAFGCDDFTITPDTVQIKMTNVDFRTVVITGINVSKSCSSSFNELMRKDDTFIFSIPCNTGEVGDFFSSKPIIYFENADSHLAKNNQGTLSGTIAG